MIADMKIAPFKTEQFFARYEFNTPYQLCNSDCESLSITELLSMAGDSLEDFGADDDRPALEGQSSAPDPASQLQSKQYLELCQDCLAKMGRKCRLLIVGHAEGYRPKELTQLLGWSPDQNKKASDDLRACLQRMKAALVQAGISWQEISQVAD